MVRRELLSRWLEKFDMVYAEHSQLEAMSCAPHDDDVLRSNAVNLAEGCASRAVEGSARNGKGAGYARASAM